MVNLAIRWSLAAILREFIAVFVVVVRTRPRAIPMIAMITTITIHAFSLLSHNIMVCGFRLTTLRDAGACVYVSRSSSVSVPILVNQCERGGAAPRLVEDIQLRT